VIRNFATAAGAISIAGTHMKNRKSAFIRNTPKGRITAVASQIVQVLKVFP